MVSPVGYPTDGAELVVSLRRNSLFAYSQIISSKTLINYKGKTVTLQWEHPTDNQGQHCGNETQQHCVLPGVGQRAMAPLLRCSCPNAESQPSREKSPETQIKRQPIKTLTDSLQEYSGHEGQGRAEDLSDSRRLKKQYWLRCQILDWILEQREESYQWRKGEIRIRSVVYLAIMYQCKYPGFDIYIMVM